MEYQTQLKIQAYVDGELSAGESREIAGLVARDAEARGLFEELSMTKSIISANESSVLMPESGDFFWSKVSKEISRLEEPATVSRFAPRPWLRWLLPVSGFAAIAIAVTLSLRQNAPAIDETENTLEEASVVSFRSQAEKMSVVWVQTDGDSPFTSEQQDGKNERNDNE